MKGSTMVSTKISVVTEVSSVIAKAHRLLDHYRSTMGTKPIGWLIGPPEYLALVHWVRTPAYGMGDVRCTQSYGWPNMLLGLPIKLKSEAGIEVELDQRDIFKFIHAKRIDK